MATTSEPNVPETVAIDSEGSLNLVRDSPGRDADAIGYRAAIRAFSDVAEALGGERDLDELLHLAAQKICELLEIRRCSVYLLDPETQLFRGQVGHADRNIDERVKRLVAGVEADRFTREILRTKQPVLLRDALADPRPIRATMREWNVRAMLGVPMILEGEVIGLMFLDNEDEPHPFTSGQEEIAATFANLAAIAIQQAQLTQRLRSTIRTAAHQNQLLRRGAEVDERLTRLVLDGANLREIAQAVADLTDKPCAISDATFRCRALASPSGFDIAPLATLLEKEWAELPTVKQSLGGLGGRMAVVGPAPAEGLNHRLIIAPVWARDERWGFLVVAEFGGRIGALDSIVAQRAATIVALELSAERRAAAAENDALEALASDLIRGARDTQGLERRADFLGVRLSAPHVLCMIAAPESDDASTPTPRLLMAAFSPADAGLRVFTTGVSEGVVAIVELPADLSPAAGVARAKEVVAKACRKLGVSSFVSVAISSVCRHPADYVRAYGEARGVLRCVEAFAPPDGARILAADDLGIGRLLLSASSRGEADRFLEDTLGALFRSNDSRVSDLLTTLQVFFACSRSVRRSAAHLGVHENTIRYRLARIEEITGLAVGSDADDQLTAQLALLVLRLEGRIPDAVDIVG